MKNTLLLLLLFPTILIAQNPPKRNIRPGDIYRLKTISDPQVSPEGNWVAYVLTSVDSAKDKRNSDVWMISWDGKETVQLTSTSEGESSPRWSPDGKYLSFLSSRQGARGSQVWLMDRRGGEGKKLTEVNAGISEYKWSPYGKKMAFVIEDLPDTSKTKTPKPLVIDRYKFKEDVQGYLFKRFEHLYLFDIESKKLDTLTKGSHNENSPVWSPDGSKIAFVSNLTADPDKNSNSDIMVIDASKNSTPRALTTWSGSDSNPQWSPDGSRIAYLRSTASENFIMYDQNILSVIPASGGNPELLTKDLDRPVGNPRWSKDSKSVFALIADDRQRYVGQIGLNGGPPVKVAGGERSFTSLEMNGNDKIVCLMSEPQLPGEIYALEKSGYRRLTKHQDEFIAPLQLSTVQGFASKSQDGTMVSNLLFLPPGKQLHQKLPAIFYIHGGPVGQDDYGFDITRQVLSAGGYAVVAVNYRGSNGRGLAFCKAIYADWGNKEVIDIHGSADHLVKEGTIDETRLGIGGWSYGGILTNYSIATDTRFKAAVSGAGSSMQLAIYGSDQYVLQYETELGQPWKNIDKYMKLSYPFLKADRIKTPTLFLVGEKDFNVPAIGSEQMYQALRSMDVPTGLIIYPGQFHGITMPSYQKDRLVRYGEWFDKYLNGLGTPKINKEIH